MVSRNALPFVARGWKTSKSNCLSLCMFAALLASVLLQLIAAVRLPLLAKGCGLPSTLMATARMCDMAMAKCC